MHGPSLVFKLCQWTCALACLAKMDLMVSGSEWGRASTLEMTGIRGFLLARGVCRCRQGHCANRTFALKQEGMQTANRTKHTHKAMDRFVHNTRQR